MRTYRYFVLIAVPQCSELKACMSNKTVYIYETDIYNSTCVFTNGKHPCIYTHSNKSSNKLLFRDQWLPTSACNADTRHLVGASSTFEVYTNVNDLVVSPPFVPL